MSAENNGSLRFDKRVKLKILDALKKTAGKILSTDLCESFSAHAALRHEFRPLFSAPRQRRREDVWNFAVKRIGPTNRLLLLEFGVWKGYSMSYFSGQFTNPNTRFLGFDSFEGLPEDWGPCPAAVFSTAGRMPETKDHRVQFIKGWFQDTLNGAIQHARSVVPNPREVLVHFDADLYSSTLFLLSKLHEEFDHYFFIFDEFTGHETRALLNFRQAFGCKVEFLAFCNYPDSRLPAQVFGVLTNRMRTNPPFETPGPLLSLREIR